MPFVYARWFRGDYYAIFTDQQYTFICIYVYFYYKDKLLLLESIYEWIERIVFIYVYTYKNI